MNREYSNNLWYAVQCSADKVAFKRTFHFFYKKLVKFALNYVSTPEEAEELVSDIFVNLWNKKETLENIHDITAYLYVAVRNQCLNHLKKKPVLMAGIYDVNKKDKIKELRDPSSDLEWKEINVHLDHAIETLPEQCRTVFILIRQEQLKYKEVGALLNISPRTVETHLNRAVSKLSKALSEYLDLTHVQKNHN